MPPEQRRLQVPRPAPAGGARGAPPRPASRQAARPSPRQVGRAATPPSRRPVPGTPKPQGIDDRAQSEAAKDAAMAKVTKNFGIPPEALNEFTLEELQIMPRLLQKMEQVGITPGGAKQAERAGFGGGPSPQQGADIDKAVPGGPGGPRR